MSISFKQRLVDPEPLPFVETPGAAPPEEKRQYWVVFNAPDVRAGEAVHISVQPYCSFRGHRISVDPTTAPAFGITGLQVGNMAIDIASDDSGRGAAGTLFPPLPLGLTKKERDEFEAIGAIRMPTCSPAQIMKMRIVNTSKETATFRAVVWGVAIDSL